MHTKSLALAAVAIISIASAAEPGRSRIYSPGHIKRDHTDATVARPPDESSSPDPTPFASSSGSKKRGSLFDDILPDWFPHHSSSHHSHHHDDTDNVQSTAAADGDGDGDGDADPTPVSSDDDGFSDTVIEDWPATETDSTSSTGILLAPTGVVMPPLLSLTMPPLSMPPLIPPVTDSPTASASASPSLANATDTDALDTPTATEDAQPTGLLGPIASLVSGLLPPEATPSSGTDADTASPDTPTTTEDAQPTDLLGPVVSLVSSILPPEATPSDGTDAGTDSSDTSTATGDLLGPVVSLVSSILPPDATPSDGTDADTASPDSPTPTGDLLGPVVSLVSSLLPPDATPSDGTDAPTSTGGGLLGPVVSLVTSLLPPAATPSNGTDPSATGDAGSLDPLGPVVSLVTSLLPPLATPSNGTDPSATGDAGSVDPLGPIVSLVTSLLPPLTTPSNGTDPLLNVTGLLPTPTKSVSLPAPPLTSVAPPPAHSPTGKVTDSIPPLNMTTASVHPHPPPATTPAPAGPLNTTSAEAEPPVSTYTIPLNGTDNPATATEAPSSDITSVPATGTITDNRPWLPTVLTVPAAISTSTSDESVPTASVALPPGLPNNISPGGGATGAQPPGTRLVQLGLRQPYNYTYVAKNPQFAALAFNLTPPALAYPFSFEPGDVVMQAIKPLPNGATSVRAWFPEAQADALRMNVLLANSAFYANPVPIVNNYTSLVDPTIDPLAVDDADDTATAGGPAATTTSNPGGDIMGQATPDQQSSTQKVQAAGIGLAAVAVAAAYGAAMFLVARRYKRKRQAHQRSSSVTQASSEMRDASSGSPALMGGALPSRELSSYGGVSGGRDSHGSSQSRTGNSGRTAIISAPVAAENSLGWN